MGQEKSPKTEPRTMVQMTVAGITMDPSNNMPIIILKETKGETAIPIWIGMVEASAIATELEGIKLARPMTHDLIKSMIDTMGVKLLRIEVNDLKDNTFFACLYIQDRQGEIKTIDCRPSDAIALALRAGADIFVGKNVIAMSQQLDLSSIQKSSGLDADGETSAASPKSDQKAGEGEKPKDKWTQILENLKPEDFGKYKM